MNLITGGTGSLGCLVAFWLTAPDQLPSASSVRSLADPRSSQEAQLLGNVAKQHETSNVGACVELVGRSGRASTVQRLLKSAEQTQSMLTIQQCDASTIGDAAAALSSGLQVILLLSHEPVTFTRRLLPFSQFAWPRQAFII